MTNADRIREMTDEELAEWLSNIAQDLESDEELYNYIYDIDTEVITTVKSSYGDTLAWLQEERDF